MYDVAAQQACATFAKAALHATLLYCSESRILGWVHVLDKTPLKSIEDTFEENCERFRAFRDTLKRACYVELEDVQDPFKIPTPVAWSERASHKTHPAVVESREIAHECYQRMKLILGKTERSQLPAIDQRFNDYKYNRPLAGIVHHQIVIIANWMRDLLGLADCTDMYISLMNGAFKGREYYYTTGQDFVDIIRGFFYAACCCPVGEDFTGGHCGVPMRSGMNPLWVETLKHLEERFPFQKVPLDVELAESIAPEYFSVRAALKDAETKLLETKKEMLLAISLHESQKVVEADLRKKWIEIKRRADMACLSSDVLQATIDAHPGSGSEYKLAEKRHGEAIESEREKKKGKL